jgi:hypothetical protein
MIDRDWKLLRESYCYMHTEECGNDLKFVMNALAISPLSLHENETKDNEPV